MSSQWRPNKQQKNFERQNQKNRNFVTFIRIVRILCTERELKDNISTFICSLFCFTYIYIFDIS